MAVYKDNATGKWRVIYRYTDWTGERKQTQKRGFATKREAVAWEHEMMLKQEGKLDMTFESFYEIYKSDKNQGKYLGNEKSYCREKNHALFRETKNCRD